MSYEHGGNIYKFNKKMIDFSANINPLGMPESAKAAICDNINSYECYPDPKNTELSQKLSQFHNIPIKNIVCGNGAADIIFKIALSLNPSFALIVSPTFCEYEKALRLVNCSVDHYILKKENDFIIDNDILDYINDKYDIMFLCNPNNPTGIPIKKQLVLKIAKKCKLNNITLVVDECFTEFLENEDEISIVKYLNELSNVIILKAFTKIYAMAGIRLGYALCSDEKSAQQIADTLQPWSVSTVASKCGIAALDEIEFLNTTKNYVKENREFLINSLKKLGFKVYASKANYIFFKSNIDLLKPLEKYNILIRSCKNYISLDEKYYRIAVRTKDENIYLLESLKKILEVLPWQNV